MPPVRRSPRSCGAGRRAAIVWCYTGPDKAEEVLAPVARVRSPLLDGVQPMPFPALQSAFDALYPPGLQWYWRADFFDEMTTRRSTSREVRRDLPTQLSTMHLYPIDGAAAVSARPIRRSATATATGPE